MKNTGLGIESDFCLFWSESCQKGKANYQAFSQTILVECECIKERACNKAKSQVSNLEEKQKHLKLEIEKILATLTSHDEEIVKVKAQMLQLQSEGHVMGEITELRA